MVTGSAVYLVWVAAALGYQPCRPPHLAFAVVVNSVRLAVPIDAGLLHRLRQQNSTLDGLGHGALDLIGAFGLREIAGRRSFRARACDVSDITLSPRPRLRPRTPFPLSCCW